MHKSSLLRSTAEKSAAEGYNQFSPRKQQPYKVADANHNTLKALKDGLENPVSLHLATMTSTSGRYCNRLDGREEYSTKEEPCSKMDSREAHKDADELYEMKNTFQHVDSDPLLRYVVRWYECSKADGAAKPPHHALQHYIDVYWRRLERQKERKR